MTDITAKVIADTVSPVTGVRITTLQLRYPRWIHQEFLTHRMFSRNASSSRAVPVQKEVDSVFDNPVLPLHIGANKPGMQADTEVDALDRSVILDRLARLGEYVAGEVQFLNEVYGVHKQVLNRYLEPWLHIDTLVTATEWDNFFSLRINPAAEPHIHMLAVAMKAAMVSSEPEDNYWHHPYYTEELDTEDFDTVDSVCAARCARVSYRNHSGTFNLKKDKALAKQLWDSKHLSPFEHIAYSGKARWYDNLYGWRSLRKEKTEQT